MSTWMTTLEKALAGEGLLAESQETCRVPRQHYARDLAELTTRLRGFVRSVSRPGDRITLFVDGTPKKCSDKDGSDLDGAFCETLRASGLAVDRVVLSDLLGISTADFHASHVYVEKTREVIRSFKPALALVLGSGSITDVVKQAIFLENLSALLISIPTALTVTAFTSAFSVIDYHGAKRTQLSHGIAATFWVKSILECAPPRMSRAGYGDLLARFVAYGDWYLGKRLGVMERYDERAFRLMEPFSRAIQENARGFSSDPLPAETIECISASLAMAGIAMSVSGETTPLSGFEHVISHGLDFLRLSSGRELVFHGEQVGLGCLTSAGAIDWLLARKSVNAEGWLENPEETGLRILDEMVAKLPVVAQADQLERARQEFIGEYIGKARRWAAEAAAGRKELFVREWPETRAHLARITMRLADMESLVQQSGLPLGPDQTIPSTPEVDYIWAIRFSPFVRSRMNIADLLFWMGQDITPMIFKPEKPPS